jgi:hypothetical protein
VIRTRYSRIRPEMGSWNASSMDIMEFEIPRPTEDIIQGYSSAWDQHVMDIDYDVRLPSCYHLIVCLTSLSIIGFSGAISSARYQLSYKTSFSPRHRR